ncbi:MAG: D-sedoheptulose-7-phosphate isomerase [Phycisphaerales bacterium]
MSRRDSIHEHLSGSASALRRAGEDAALVEAAGEAAEAMVASLRSGGKVLACGNGGSSADAMHFAEELTGRFRNDRPAIAALACVDAGHITCAANDFGFERVFSRWIEALARQGDVVVLLSTSGNSANILHAAEAAKAKGAVTVAMLGRDGGKMRGTCIHEIIVHEARSERIQEVHMTLLHAFVDVIEDRLFGKG